MSANNTPSGSGENTPPSISSAGLPHYDAMLLQIATLTNRLDDLDGKQKTSQDVETRLQAVIHENRREIDSLQKSLHELQDASMNKLDQNFEQEDELILQRAHMNDLQEFILQLQQSYNQVNQTCRSLQERVTLLQNQLRQADHLGEFNHAQGAENVLQREHPAARPPPYLGFNEHMQARAREAGARPMFPHNFFGPQGAHNLPGSPIAAINPLPPNPARPLDHVRLVDLVGPIGPATLWDPVRPMVPPRPLGPLRPEPNIAPRPFFEVGRRQPVHPNPGRVGDNRNVGARGRARAGVDTFRNRGSIIDDVLHHLRPDNFHPEQTARSQADQLQRPHPSYQVSYFQAPLAEVPNFTRAQDNPDHVRRSHQPYVEEDPALNSEEYMDTESDAETLIA